ncbi:MAG: MFS transporter [candidate division WOR-3 bacterium]
MKFLNLPRNVKALGFVSFFNDIASEMINPLLPVFITTVLKAGTVALGFIEGVAEATNSFLKLFSGIISDKIKKKKSLIFSGYFLASFSRPFIGITNSWIQVLFLKFIDRFGKGIRTSPRDALISLSVESNERGKAFGFQRAMDHLGALTGPVIAFFLLNFLDLRKLFLISIFPGIIAIFILIYFVKERIDEKKEFFSLSFKFPKKFYFLIFIFFLFNLGNSSDAFLILKAKEEGIKILFLPLLWSLFHLVKSIFSIPSGILSDKIGRKKLIMAGWLIYSITYLLFTFAKTLPFFIFLFLFYGLYFALSEGNERALIGDLTREELRGSAYGVYHFAQGISLFLSSFIFGILWNYFGSKIPFLFGSFISFISLLLLFLFF